MSSLGDGGSWTWDIPWAWQSLAARDFECPPEPPSGRFVPAEVGTGALITEEAAAVWTPVVHVLRFGAGWPDPAQGISRWLETGLPRNGRILTWLATDFVSKHGLSDAHFRGFLGWMVQARFVRYQFLSDFVHRYGFPFEPDAVAGSYERTQMDRDCQSFKSIGLNAEGDSLHLSVHCSTPLDADHGVRVLEQGKDSFVLIADTYAGWYDSLLTDSRLCDLQPGVPVEVFVKPVGWLGKFRRSSVTGLWYRGAHEVHLMGHAVGDR